MDNNVTPIGQAPSKRELEASLSRHPAGRRKGERCPECPHTVKAHTEGADGCAYCECQLLPPLPL